MKADLAMKKASWIWLCFHPFVDSYGESDSWTKCQVPVQLGAFSFHNALKYHIWNMASVNWGLYVWQLGNTLHLGNCWHFLLCIVLKTTDFPQLKWVSLHHVKFSHVKFCLTLNAKMVMTFYWTSQTSWEPSSDCIQSRVRFVIACSCQITWSKHDVHSVRKSHVTSVVLGKLTCPKMIFAWRQPRQG